jgi:CO/xanthine dehydrogenase Mo-binding subunit
LSNVYSTVRPPVGGSDIRIDTLDKVTGATEYVEDMKLPGLLHAAVLRSPHHHARLLVLDTMAAAMLPGVVRIITAADVPGLNGLDGYSRAEPLLTPVGDTLRQRGAPIALVVAESEAQARAAAAAIAAKYEVLPHVFDAAEALEPDAFPIYPGGNVLSSRAVKHGDLAAAFAASDVIVETEYRTAFQEHATLERVTTLGLIGDDGRVTVYGGTHEPHWQQGYIGQALGLDPDRVRVIFPPTGGSFGDRQDPWPLAAVGLAVYLIRRPVRLAYSRREAFDASPKRHPYHMRFTIGATAAGRLTGIRVRITANTGGYDSAGFWIPGYAVLGSGGAYLWQAVDAAAQAVYTNGPKAGQFRGYGSPQGTFGLECSLDELCQRLGADPLEFRLANRIGPDSISFLGYPVGETLGYAEALEALRPHYRAYLAEAEAFNRGEPLAQDAALRLRSGQASRPLRLEIETTGFEALAGSLVDERNRLKPLIQSSGGRFSTQALGGLTPGKDLRMGVGLAGMWYRFGKSGSLRVETHAELAPDGHFILYCSAPDYGQGISTVMVQLAAETLGIPRDRFELVNVDTALTPDSGIQGASRATYFIGSSLCNAVRNLRDEIFGAAAELLDCAPTELTLAADRVASGCAAGGSVSLAEVAREFDLLGKPRRLLGIFDLSPLYPEETRPEYVPLFTTGAQAAQVLVDMATGLAQVTRIAAAHDVGRAINPPNAIGQIQGAIVMGVGTALTEQYVPGASAGFSDYILPMVDAMPEIETILVEVPSFHGPLGAKGLGEAAILPAAPAIINALSRAIGARIRELPASPPRVLAAIRSRGGFPIVNAGFPCMATTPL